MYLSVQYGLNGYIQDGIYAEDDADSATVWVCEPMYEEPDGSWVGTGEFYIALSRSPRGKWMIDTSEHARVSATGHRYRFRTVKDAVEYVARVNRHNVTIVD